jgi:hypothetical protein
MLAVIPTMFAIVTDSYQLWLQLGLLSRLFSFVSVALHYRLVDALFPLSFIAYDQP